MGLRGCSDRLRCAVPIACVASALGCGSFVVVSPVAVAAQTTRAESAAGLPVNLPPLLSPQPTRCACPTPGPSSSSRSAPSRHASATRQQPPASRPTPAEQVARAATRAGIRSQTAAGAGAAATGTRPMSMVLPTLNPRLPPPMGYADPPQAQPAAAAPWPALALVDALALGLVFGIARRGRRRRLAH